MTESNILKTLNQSEIIKLVILWLMFTATAPFYFHYAIPYHPYKIILYHLCNMKDMGDYVF